MPSLSVCGYSVVIVDEGLRSQYELIDGLARYMRDALSNAGLIGFIGNPIGKTDANTWAIFGNCIRIHDIQRAVAEKATVSIYHDIRVVVKRIPNENGSRSRRNPD